jgi:uncharacterized membrane protein
MDILTETLRAFVVGGIIICFLWGRHNGEISNIKGWNMMFFGFVLIFFGTVIDITDNFDALNKYVVIGDTEVEAFLEKIVGYLMGFLLVAIGIWQWLPKLIEHSKLSQKQHEMEIQEHRLRVLKATLLTVQDIMNGLTGNITEYQEQAKRNKSLDEECGAFLNYIIQDTTERMEKLSRLESTPEKPMAAGIGIDYETPVSP